MKCIFCKEKISEDKRSREHIIPKCLGGKKVIHNICKDCNNKLGVDFESKLGNNEVFNFICAFYRVKSRKDSKFKKPNLEFKDGTTLIRTDEEGHFLMYVKPNYNFSDTGFEIDQSESQETIDGMTKGKIKQLQSENDSDTDYKIIKDIKKLKIYDAEDFVVDVDVYLLNELFIKITYEFACLCLESSYLDDDTAILLKNTIIEENYNYLFENNSIIKLSCDYRQLNFCINKVAEIAHDNTINYHYDRPLIHCSNGNYLHKISLINKDGKLFVLISLFDIFKYKICVSNKNYGYDEGLIAKLTTGICDGNLINNTYSPYNKILAKLRNINNE